MNELLEVIYDDLLERLEKEGYTVNNHDYEWEDSFYMFIEEDNSQTFRLRIQIENGERIAVSLDLASIFVEGRYYKVGYDYLPNDFNDFIILDAKDTELMKKIMEFVDCIKVCNISDRVLEIFKEIGELRSKYTTTELSFLAGELKHEGY